MPKRHHYRRRSAESPEMDMTTFLNLMVVLVPFLLIGAVFSRMTIVELDLPTSNVSGGPTEPSYRIEVIVRESGLQLTDGKVVLARIPKVDGRYDLKTLSEHVVSLKQSHPDDEDASVLLEPSIEYDHLIQVMDAVRGAERPGGSEGEVVKLALFTNVSIGDAP
jgi:biopolymer transport protein ExbD